MTEVHLVSCSFGRIADVALATCIGPCLRGGLTPEGLGPAFWRELPDEALRMCRRPQQDVLHRGVPSAGRHSGLRTLGTCTGGATLNEPSSAGPAASAGTGRYDVLFALPVPRG